MIETLTGALVEAAANANDTDREWAVQRPSRGVHATAVRQASTIPARWRPFALCVSDRESGGSYTARNDSSSASGRWQFLDTSWRRGLSFMVRDRLIRAGMPTPAARSVRTYLAATHISRWPGPYQDAGFVAVVSKGGAFHWRLAGSRCEQYR